MPNELVDLVCPTCGGKLARTAQPNVWTCAYCGVERIMPAGTAAAALPNIAAWRAEINAMLMDIVLAVGQFTSLYPQWGVSQWVASAKGEGGELGAYRGEFLERLVSRLEWELQEKEPLSIVKKRDDGSVRAAAALLEKLKEWQKQIVEKERAIRAANQTQP